VKVGSYSQWVLNYAMATEPSRRLCNAGYGTINVVSYSKYCCYGCLCPLRSLIISVIITDVCSRETIRTFSSALIAGDKLSRGYDCTCLISYPKVNLPSSLIR